MLSINASRLERWLGAAECEHISRQMAGWYGPPIAVGNVPGKVFVHRGGDFRGTLAGGGFASGADYFWERAKMRFKRWQRSVAGKMYTGGFADFSDLMRQASVGNMRRAMFQKSGATGVAAVTNSLWGLGSQPAAGADGSAAPGGRAPTSSTTGALSLGADPASGYTRHFVSGFPSASVAANTLLLYDRIFDVAKTMNSSATESVTGVPSRYQSTTSGDPDSAEGNFLFVEVGGTALAATAHNWTTCLYTDQSGNGSATLPSLTGNSAAIARRLDHPVNQWFAPLATGDTGIQQLDQMQCSAAVATGVINFVIGHPIAWMPCIGANAIFPSDGIRDAFQVVRIFDQAALAFLEINKPSTSATNYNGEIITVDGNAP